LIWVSVLKELLISK